MSLAMIDRRPVLSLALVAALALLACPARAEKAAAKAPAVQAPQAETVAQASPTAKGSQAAQAAKGTVNINSANAGELARLPRVGAKLADRIVSHRGQHGPFKRVEDLMEVKGVGEKMFASLKPYLSTSGTTTLASKVTSAKPRSGSARASGKAPSRGAIAPASASASR